MCACGCHSYSTITEFQAVDVSDPVDAALACDSCRDSHCLALLLRRLANDPEPEKREKFEWTDPPAPSPDATGEGSE